mgnify:CR=1 FL=1
MSNLTNDDITTLLATAGITGYTGEHTALGGSSLGGLITLHLGLEYPDVFGQLLVVSPSVWWDQHWIVDRVNNLEKATGQRIWLDIGTGEGKASIENTRMLRVALEDKGWNEKNLHYLEAAGAGHNESAWAKRVPEMLRFLYLKSSD